MQDILLDFTQVPSLGNEHRVINILFNKTVYVAPWCRSVSSVKKIPELNPTPMRTNNDRMVLRSTCPMFRTNKSRFVSRKEIKDRGLGELYRLSCQYLKRYLVVEPEKALRLQSTMGLGKK